MKILGHRPIREPDLFGRTDEEIERDEKQAERHRQERERIRRLEDVDPRIVITMVRTVSLVGIE